MNEIKCPKCGTMFQIDESDYDSIVKQIRDKEFEKEILSREEHSKIEKENAIEIAKAQLRAELSKTIKNQEIEINNLKNQIKNQRTQSELDVQKAVAERENTIYKLSNELKQKSTEFELKEKSMKETYESKIKDKDEQIAYYRDFKAKQSTKMVGESLEVHCSTEFNQIRPLFDNCTFEKDNDAKTRFKR